MAALAEEPNGRRLALVIATSSYSDPTLAKLRSPGHDARNLAEVLADDTIGEFAVERLLDARVDTVRRRIALFCAQGGPRDLALIYLSCHGLLDDRGRLYYAATDTDRELLSVTAVQAAWLNDHLDDCRCRRQILILDCCHSGAFAKGAKGTGALALRERFEARGRIVLTASRATEYSFEGSHIAGHGENSVFTAALVDGLRTGDADRDHDGLITVNELYDYAFDAVKAREPRQSPSLWSYGAEGNLVVARSPRDAIIQPAPSPEHLNIQDVQPSAPTPTPTAAPTPKRRPLSGLGGRRPTRTVVIGMVASLGVLALAGSVIWNGVTDPPESTSGERTTQTNTTLERKRASGADTTCLPISTTICTLGGPARNLRPACPASCQAVSRTTGFNRAAGALDMPTRVPFTGRLTGWSIRLGNAGPKQRTFFSERLGGPPRAGIVVLRRGSGVDYRLVARSDTKNLTKHLGERVEFGLKRSIPVRAGDIVGLTIPTWAPAIAPRQEPGFSWRSSRTACTDTARQQSHSSVGTTVPYRCLFKTAQLTYAASLNHP